MFFPYGQVELEHLKRRDKKLAAAIDRIGMIQRDVDPDVFASLIRSIIAQQISSKAALTVNDRLKTLLNGEFTPQAIVNSGIEAIQSCGISFRSAGYILGIADAALNGTVDFANLNKLKDDEIIGKLSALNGIGVWTAEMLLIFSLCRPDVVSYGDLAIRRGMMYLYGLKELPKDKFLRYRKRYAPYGSVASLYLWELSV